MLPLAWYFIRQRLNKLRSEAQSLATVLKALMLLFMVVAGYAASDLESTLFPADCTSAQAVQMIDAFTMCWPFLFNILLYRAKTDLIPPIYPITTREKTFVEIAYDLVGIEYAVPLVLNLSILYFSAYYRWYNFAAAVLLLLTSCFLINLLKLALERKILFSGYFALAATGWACLSAGVFFFGARLEQEQLLFLLLIGGWAAATFLFLAWFETQTVARESGALTRRLEKNLHPLSMLPIHRKEVFRNIAVTSVTRIGLLFSMYFLYNDSDQSQASFSKSVFFILPYTSYPIYVNLWGHVRDVWLILQQSHEEKNVHAAFSAVYRRLTFYPLLIDLSITLIWVAALKITAPAYYVYLLSAYAMFYSFGYFKSLLDPYNYKSQHQTTFRRIIMPVAALFCINLYVPLAERLVLLDVSAFVFPVFLFLSKNARLVEAAQIPSFRSFI